MQEAFLHYIWQFQKFTDINLKTESGQSLQVLKVGTLNKYSGPDFFNAQLLIANQKWAGNVEIHKKSSDWFVHRHEKDSAYDTVILHVVWEDDVVVFDANNNPLETLVIKELVDKTLLTNYKRLMLQKNWIFCEKDILAIDDFTWGFWKEKLIINRLQRKTEALNVVFEENNQDWEALFFVVLAKSFGLKVNQNQFSKLAQGLSFSVFKKELSNSFSLEVLLFGQANMLIDNLEDGYYQQLQKEYDYLKQKYQLNTHLIKMGFFGLRPVSFPTIRLSQFAMLYHQNKTSLFAEIIKLKTVEQAKMLFKVSASEYWDTHYTFGKTSLKRKKKISDSFVELLLINVVIPIQYKYAKNLGKNNIEHILKLYKALRPENNGITTAFKKMKIPVLNALDSQSLIELKNEYCIKQKCLQCQIGYQLLYKKQN